MSGLQKNDVVFVVGNLPELGAWNHNQAIQLTREHNDGPDDACSTAFGNNGSPDFSDFYGNSQDETNLVGDCSENLQE